VVDVGRSLSKVCGSGDERGIEIPRVPSSFMCQLRSRVGSRDGTASPREVPGRVAFPETGPPHPRVNGGGIGSSCPASAQCGRESAPPAACWRIRCRRRISLPPGSYKPNAFHRVSQRPPLRRRACWSPLPRALARFGPSPPGAALVPSSPFLPASTASSSRRFAGLLRPASDLEVHRVATHRRRMPATASALSLRCLPSRAFPFREAVHASPRGLAPLSFSGDGCRRDSEALFRSEIRDDDGSWPNRIARCSPGLPHLEPHTSGPPRRIDFGGWSAASAPPLPEGGGHAGCAGEDVRAHITEKGPSPLARTVAAPPGWRPCRSSHLGTTAVIPGRPRGAPRDHRQPANASPEGVCVAAAAEVSMAPLRRMARSPRRSSRLLVRVS